MDLFTSRTTRIVVVTVLVVALALLGFSAFL
jgi:hypothetical protein